LFPSPFLEIDVTSLMASIHAAIESLRTNGASGEEFPRGLIPVLGGRKKPQ